VGRRVGGASLEGCPTASLTLWDASTAITAYARGIDYQDERVEIEKIGGKVLKMAA
jgi:hypothetical protein